MILWITYFTLITTYGSEKPVLSLNWFDKQTGNKVKALWMMTYAAARFLALRIPILMVISDIIIDLQYLDKEKKSISNLKIGL